MPTKARASKIDKYSSSPQQEFMTHRGQKYHLGGVAEMLRHCDRQWYAYLERLINNPDEPNPWKSKFGGGWEAKIAEPSALNDYCCIWTMIRHMWDQSKAAGCKWLAHDALSLMTSHTTMDKLTDEGMLDFWLLPK